MSHIFVRCDRVIQATPAEVFAILADYRDRHQRLLPANFLNYRVEKGGQGHGTVIGYRFRAAGRERDYTMDIEETVKGQVLTERDNGSSLVTRWSVLPVEHGRLSKVSVESDWEGGNGVGGFFERTFAPLGLRNIYDEILANLAHMVHAPEAGEKIMLADRKHLKINTTAMMVALGAAVGVLVSINYWLERQKMHA